jgi:Zn-dependent protease
MSIEPIFAARPDAGSCGSCGAELAPGLLSCPVCHRLVHAEQLKGLAQAAERAEQDGDLSTAMARWREALSLLPVETRQHAIIIERIARLGLEVEAHPNPKAGTPGSEENADDPQAPQHWSRGAASGVIGTIALAFWKFKFLAFVVLSKAKFLLLGLTKASTFLSMFAMVGVYWSLFGLPFALGIVLSIYIHEMGHVAALLRYGVPASAPLFIPGLGAVIRLRQEFTDPRQDARVALAGPAWGLGAALVCALLFLSTGEKVWAALAQFGAFLNLFNLMPIWQLDGGRAFRSLNRPQRWLAAAALATVWAISEDGIALVLMLVAAFRALTDRPSDQPDRGALAQYIALVAVLSFMSYGPALRLR